MFREPISLERVICLGPSVGARFFLDLAAEPERGLSDLGVGSQITEDGRVEGAMGDHDGVVPDAGLSRGLPDHKGGQDDEGVGASHKKIPSLEFLGGGFLVITLLDQGCLCFRSERLVAEFRGQ